MREILIYLNKLHVDNIYLMSDQGRGYPYKNVGNRGTKYGNFGIDVKEAYLKKEIARQGGESTVDFSAVSNWSSGPSQQAPSQQAPSDSALSSATDDVYLYFDSTARDFTSDIAGGELKFNISTINNQKPVDNVISLRINSFYFPRVSAAATVPDYFFFDRVYVQIGSSSMPSSQAVLAQNGNRYHFECEIATLNSVAIKLTPIEPVYIFPRPIQSISDITFNFMVPLNFRNIVIPNDTLQVRAVAGTNPGQFVILPTNDTSAIGAVGVPVAPGVAVYISNFNSASTTLNNLANSATGYFVDNIVSTTLVTISTLNLATLAVDTPCVMIVAKNRVGIEARFKSIRGQLTNGLVSTTL